jgi:hypothetical protein
LFDAAEPPADEDLWEEEPEIDLSELFPETADVETDSEEQPVLDTPVEEPAGVSDQPDTSSVIQSLAPSQRSGRERRQPKWLKDFITNRGIAK